MERANQSKFTRAKRSVVLLPDQQANHRATPQASLGSLQGSSLIPT